MIWLDLTYYDHERDTPGGLTTVNMSQVTHVQAHQGYTIIYFFGGTHLDVVETAQFVMQETYRIEAIQEDHRRRESLAAGWLR